MTTPLGALPYPTNYSTSADGPAAFLALAKKIDSQITPPFANNGARDTAYSAWVAAGNTMSNGLTCTVAGVPQVYRSGQWRGVGPGPVHTGVGPPTFGPYSIQGAPEPGLVVGRINIPDPGYEYRIHIDAAVEAYPVQSNGSDVGPFSWRVDSVINFNGTLFDLWRGDTGNHHRHSGLSPNTATGATIVNFQVYRPTAVASSGDYSTSSTNFWMRAQVIPV